LLSALYSRNIAAQGFIPCGDTPLRGATRPQLYALGVFFLRAFGGYPRLRRQGRFSEVRFAAEVVYFDHDNFGIICL
jgi:hypothetical protein